MSSICTGLAVLGLCFPLPGQTLTALEEAGWSVFDKDQPRWSASNNLGAGTYLVSALVAGAGGKVTEVLILEGPPPTQDGYTSPLSKVLERACAKGDPSVCRFGEIRVQRLSCAGGWAFLSLSAKIDDAAAGCKRYAPLFDDARKRRTP